MKKINLIGGLTLVVVLGACSKGAKDNEAALREANGISEQCFKHSSSDESAKGSFKDLVVLNVNYNLYWSGAKSSVLNVWSDNGVNEQFSVSYNPLVVRKLNTDDQSVEKEVRCLESLSNANYCISVLEETLSIVRSDLNEDTKALEEKAESADLLSSDSKLSLECAKDFSTKQLEILKAYKEENTPKSNYNPYQGFDINRGPKI